MNDLARLGISFKVSTGDNAAVAATVVRELGLAVTAVEGYSTRV